MPRSTAFLLLAVAAVLCAGTALASCKTDADCPSSYCQNGFCHACGDNCCLTDKDCHGGSYCMKDNTKHPPYMCHTKDAVESLLAETVAPPNLTPAGSKDADAVKKEVEYVINKYKSVVAGVGIAIGVALAFAGYKLVGPTLFLAGAAAAGFATFVVTDTTISSEWSYKPHVVIITSIVVALLGGLLVKKLRKVGVFLAGAAGGAVGALILNSAVMFRLQKYAPESVPSLYLYIAVALLGVIGGILALKLERVILIVASTVVGSFGTVAGIGYFAGHYPTGYNSFVHGDKVNEDPIVWAYLGGMVVMAVAGAIVQFQTTEKKKKKNVPSSQAALLYAAPQNSDGAPLSSVNVTHVAGYV